MLLTLLFVVIGFASGGVMYSYEVPLRVKGIDIVRDSPDGNAGVWNVGRFAGKGMAAICLVLDVLKGAVPVFVAWHLVDWTSPLFVLVVIAPVLGHVMSPFRHALSGKGIATAFGALLGLVPLAYSTFVLFVIYGFFLLVLTVHPHELLSICACTCFMAIEVMKGILVGWMPALCCIGVALCVIVRACQTMPVDEPREVLLFGKRPLHLHK